MVTKKSWEPILPASKPVPATREASADAKVES